MNSETALDKIIDRIKTLRKIADSTHSKHEKETALSLIAKFIAEHQVTEAQIAASGGVEEQDDLKGSPVYTAGKGTPWKQELVFSTAELNNTYALKFNYNDKVSHRSKIVYRLFGKPSDIEITKYMFEYLMETIDKLGHKNVTSNGKRGLNPARQAYCLGCVRGFVTKMKVARAEIIQSSSVAMVLVNRPKAIEEKYMQENNIKKIKSAKASKAYNPNEEFTAGYMKGQTIEVSKGLNGSLEETKRLN